MLCKSDEWNNKLQDEKIFLEKGPLRAAETRICQNVRTIVRWVFGFVIDLFEGLGFEMNVSN
jgi:hypothetical protein